MSVRATCHTMHFCWTVSGPSAGAVRDLANARLALVDRCAEDLVPSLQACCFWWRAAWHAGQELSSGLATNRQVNSFRGLSSFCADIVSFKKITGHGACAGVLFLVEGAGQGALGKNWGDGIATDSQVISSRGLSDPNAFFTALLQKAYLSQVIIGPHVYPPSISQAAEETQVSSRPLDLPAHLNRPHPFFYSPVAEAPPQPGHQWAPPCTRLLFPRHRRKLK